MLAPPVLKLHFLKLWVGPGLSTSLRKWMASPPGGGGRAEEWGGKAAGLLEKDRAGRKFTAEGRGFGKPRMAYARAEKE